MDKERVRHHRIFDGAAIWSGRIEDHVDIDFLGAKEDKQFFLPAWRDAPRDFSKTHAQWASLPEFSEEYFEWIDFLAAVKSARRRFVMMELGAGYGRWLMRAAAAVRRYNPVPMLLIGVEGEPTHVQWMRQNFSNNGLNPDAHRIIQAAVAASLGTAYFPVGDPLEWGQFILDDASIGCRTCTLTGEVFETSHVIRIPQVTIADATGGEELIDIIDMDIQGAEAAVMAQAIDFCSERVRLIHIGTHSDAIQDDLREIFTRAGWLKRFDFPGRRDVATPYGVLPFNDGVQSWANPQFAGWLEAVGLMEPSATSGAG